MHSSIFCEQKDLFWSKSCFFPWKGKCKLKVPWKEKDGCNSFQLYHPQVAVFFQVAVIYYAIHIVLCLMPRCLSQLELELLKLKLSVWVSSHICLRLQAFRILVSTRARDGTLNHRPLYFKSYAIYNCIISNLDV